MDSQPDPAPGATSGGRRAAGMLEAEVLSVLQSVDRALAPGEVAELLGGGLTYSTPADLSDGGPALEALRDLHDLLETASV